MMIRYTGLLFWGRPVLHRVLLHICRPICSSVSVCLIFFDSITHLWRV